MPSNFSLSELDDRIAVLRDNIRQLIEQAAGASGGQNEERTADRIAQQAAEPDKLVLECEDLARNWARCFVPSPRTAPAAAYTPTETLVINEPLHARPTTYPSLT